MAALLTGGREARASRRTTSADSWPRSTTPDGRPPVAPGPGRAAERTRARGAAAAGTDLDGPDIARELVVSLNTVRTHTKNIYAKLGVNSRRAAVRRAAELGLLVAHAGRPARPLAA